MREGIASASSRRHHPSWDALEVILPPGGDSSTGGRGHALIRMSVYDSASVGGSNVERCSYDRSRGAAAGFVGAFEARVWYLTQGEERKIALIRFGW